MGLFQRSIAAGILIVCILALRRLAFQKFSKRVFVLLWKMALLRLLLPFSFPVENVFVRQRVNYIMIEAQKEMSSAAVSAESLGMFRLLLKNIGLVWFIGTAGLALVFAWGYVRAYLQLREAIPLQDSEGLDGYGACIGKCGNALTRRVRIGILDRITTPVTYGIVFPRIVLPKIMDLTDKDRVSYVLKHEINHIQSMDNLWKILAIAALCLHWFNPLVLVMFFTLNKDLEIACDESVISSMDEKDRKSYAMTLVALAEIHAKLPLAYSGFGRSAVPERIKEIMNYKKMTKIGSLCAALVLLGSTAVFVSAKESGKDDTAVTALPSASVEVSGWEENKVETYVAGEKTEDGSGKNCVSVFFDEGISQERIEEIGNELLALKGVTGVGYTSPDEAWAVFAEEYLDEEAVLSFNGVNPLKDSGNYKVYLSENSGEVIGTIRNIDGVRRVTSQ